MMYFFQMDSLEAVVFLHINKKIIQNLSNMQSVFLVWDLEVFTWTKTAYCILYNYFCSPSRVCPNEEIQTPVIHWFPTSMNEIIKFKFLNVLLIKAKEQLTNKIADPFKAWI